MKYVCLIHLDDATFEPLSQPERDWYTNAILDNDEALRRSGHWVDAHALAAPAEAVSVRVRNGSLSMVDGPFAETKEHLSGLVIIEARDLNDAIRLAAAMPLSGMGTIEVRPVRMIDYLPDVEAPA